MLILFDYGHGGKDPGATYKGRQEANDVLLLRQAIAKQLRAAGLQIDETRTTNTTLSLQQRIEIERKKKYDLFISFHRNAFKPETANGAEVFVFNFANSASKSKPLADKIQRALVNVGFKDRGVKEANFYVLKNTRAPALLLEVGFIDNSIDNKLFDEKFDSIVDVITQAIMTNKNKVNTCPTCGQKIGG